MIIVPNTQYFFDGPPANKSNVFKLDLPLIIRTRGNLLEIGCVYIYVEGASQRVVKLSDYWICDNIIHLEMDAKEESFRLAWPLDDVDEEGLWRLYDIQMYHDYLQSCVSSLIDKKKENLKRIDIQK